MTIRYLQRNTVYSLTERGRDITSYSNSVTIVEPLLRTFSDIKGAFERIKDMLFTFGDLAMYMSTCPENQQAI